MVVGSDAPDLPILSCACNQAAGIRRARARISVLYMYVKVITVFQVKTIKKVDDTCKSS